MEKILTRSDVPKLQNEIYVFRGVKSATDKSKALINKLKDMDVGEILEDRAFVSTSVQYPPDGFVGKTCCLLKIKLPKGTPAYYIGADSSVSHEEEVILPPGTAFKLTEKHPKGADFKGRTVDLFVFDCPSCLTNDRYILSQPPSQFNLYSDIKNKDYQTVDDIVGRDRLSLFDLRVNNKYIPNNYSEVIRLMSWNIHENRNKNGKNRSKEIQEVIKQIQPDIVGLQENDKDIASSCKADQGNHGRLYNTIISNNYPINSAPTIDLGPKNRCAIVASAKGISVANLHLEVTSQKDRLVNLEKLLSTIDNNTIIMGDFNAYKREDYTPENYERLKTIKQPYHPDMNIFETIRRLENAGYIDVYQQRANDLGVPLTDIIPVNTTDKGGRIDFIFVHKDAKFKIEGVYTYYTDVSDHIPIIVDIKAEPNNSNVETLTTNDESKGVSYIESKEQPISVFEIPVRFNENVNFFLTDGNFGFDTSDLTTVTKGISNRNILTQLMLIYLLNNNLISNGYITADSLMMRSFNHTFHAIKQKNPDFNPNHFKFSFIQRIINDNIFNIDSKVHDVKKYMDMLEDDTILVNKQLEALKNK